MPEVLAYRRALATTSRKLAVRKASFASRPLRSSRRSSSSSFLEPKSAFSSRASAASPASIIWASSTSCSAVSKSYSPMAVRYCETRSVVRRPRSSVSLLTTVFDVDVTTVALLDRRLAQALSRCGPPMRGHAASRRSVAQYDRCLSPCEPLGSWAGPAGMVDGGCPASVGEVSPDISPDLSTTTTPCGYLFLSVIPSFAMPQTGNLRGFRDVESESGRGCLPSR